MGFALLLYRMLTDALTPEMGAFHLMSLMTYPEHFAVAPDTDLDIEVGAQHAARLSRDDPELRRFSNQELSRACSVPIESRRFSGGEG
jgi:hypothetical protein